MGYLYLKKMTGGSEVARVVLTNCMPQLSLLKKLPATVIAFPQFEGSSVMEPEAIMSMGWRETFTISFELSDSVGDISNGIGKEAVEEMIPWLDDEVFTMVAEDYYHLYAEDFWGSNYLGVIITEFTYAMSSGEGKIAKCSISGERARNPLG